MDKDKKTHAIMSLRRASYRWKHRWSAEKRSRVARGEYFCEHCGIIGKKHDMQMDHVIPVVDPIEGWKDFDTFIDRLYVNETGWQRLCKPCHSEKTKQENSIRKEHKKPKTFKKRTKKKK